MKPYRLFLLFFILICLYPDPAHALFTSEYATFKSFYRESSAVSWTIAGVVAIVTGALIITTGGTAAGPVAAVGSWIGGLKGLSGAAATKWGLALLGGGAKASGGLGIVGGTALLSASLTFGTEIGFDYALGKATSEYSYNKLVEQSKRMPTLPLPVNGSGPEAYEGAIAILEGIDKKSPLSANSNQKRIQQAINQITTDKEDRSTGADENVKAESWRSVFNDYLPRDTDERIKTESLLALLYFYSHDYGTAKAHAETAIQEARTANIRRTLPAFIYATSSLYEPEFDFAQITNDYFRYSVLAEKDNPLIPLLFSIYLDRTLLRFNDNFLDETALQYIFEIMKSPALEDLRVEHYILLLSRYFMRLKLEQQKITSLASAANDTIKKSPETLSVVKDSLERYTALLRYTEQVMSALLRLDVDAVKSREQIVQFNQLLLNYTKDRERLAVLVDDLKAYQLAPRSV